VESAVKYVKRNFFAPREFADIQDANRRLDAWTIEIAGQRLHGTTHRRPLELFEIEKAHLRPLPPTRFECVEWKKVTVHTDSQIAFERRLYPVPWRLMGKKVWVQATAKTIAVYWEDTRVATHQRNKPVPPEVYDQYLPDQRSPLRYRSQSFWLDRAERLGADVVDYVREVFACDDVLSQLRTVQAVVTHLEKFPPARAQAACRRAQYYGNYTYPGVRDILRQGLDREPLPVAVVPAATATERPRYARRLDELLQLPLLKEDSDDAH